MRFTDWLAEKVGTRRWCVAQRLTTRHEGRYDLAITPARYDALEREYEQIMGGEAQRLAADYERRFGISLVGQIARTNVMRAAA